MHASTPAIPISKKTPWVGRIVSALPILFMLFDGILKVAKPEPVTESFIELGIPENLAVGIGILEIACIAVYVLPRTAVLGLILLTGYLGGAIAIQVRAEADLFPIVFPIILGALLWGGQLLRDVRFRELVAPQR